MGTRPCCKGCMVGWFLGVLECCALLVLAVDRNCPSWARVATRPGSTTTSWLCAGTVRTDSAFSPRVTCYRTLLVATYYSMVRSALNTTNLCTSPSRCSAARSSLAGVSLLRSSQLARRRLAAPQLWCAQLKFILDPCTGTHFFVQSTPQVQQQIFTALSESQNLIFPAVLRIFSYLGGTFAEWQNLDEKNAAFCILRWQAASQEQYLQESQRKFCVNFNG